MPGEDPLIGKVLNGRFQIIEPLGVGGMGKVYRAIQTPLERVVAVKVLSPNFPQSRDPGFQKRFLREASLTSKLRHPNTVTVIDYGQTEDGVFYIAMEYLEGHTLAEVLTRQRQLDYVRAIGIIGQVARSLREAHALGVIHRDLKPANVMLVPDRDQDVVKVLDFGLVKSFADDGQAAISAEITQSGTFLGSPQYMAPEQARNQSDPRSDVYSLGVLLYQILMGRPPFLSKDYLEVIFQHHKEPPPPFRQVRPDLEVPAPVEALVMKCLAKDPAQRYQSMDELIEGLRTAGMNSGGSGVFRATLAATTTGQFNTPASLFGVKVKDDTEAIEINLDESPLKSKKVLAGIAVALSLLIGFGLVFAFSRSGETPGTQVAAVDPSQAVPEDEGADAPAAEITQTGEKGSTVRFRIGSLPAGASVFVGGKNVGRTPTQIELPADADGTATAEITFALDGYHTLTLVAGGSGTVVLTQPLQKRPARGPASVATRNAREAKASNGSTSAPFTVMETEAAPNVERAPNVGRAPSPEDTVPAVASSAAPVVNPASIGPATILPFGEGMTRPVQLGGKDIVYTREARAAKVQGVMIVKCVITLQGKLDNCRVLKPVPLMEQTVLEALRTRTYKPVTFQGKPVAVDYLFNIRLTLPR